MRFQVVTALLAFFAGYVARADTVQVNGLITSGQATESPGSPLMAAVSGPDLLSFTINAHDFGQLPACCFAPGSIGDVREFAGAGGASQSPFDTGSAFYHSGEIAFPCAAFPGSNCGMIIVLNYTLVIPDFSNAPPGPQMVTAPFTASANFSTCFPDATTCFNGNFLGAGTVTVTLQFLPGLNINANTGTVFDFAAIPESSTMELTILGLAAFTLAYIGPLKRRLIGKVSHL